MKVRFRHWIAAALVILSLLYWYPAHAQVLSPARGGTGTSTIPSYGKVLIGQPNGTYGLVSTTSLGITPVGVSTTSVDYWLTTKTTSAVAEGSNLYYTVARLTSGLLQGYDAIFGDASSTNATSTNATSTNLAVTGSFDFLGTVITDVASWFSGLFDTNLAAKTTSDLAEGSNLYFTNSRADARAVSVLSATTSLPHITTLSGLSLPYSQLTGTPTIPTKTSDLTNDSGFITGYTETDPIFSASQAANITGTDITHLANLSGTNTGDQDLSGYALTSSLAAVATSGSYNDLSDTPTIPAFFAYPFPSNATSTKLTFSGGLSTTYASTTAVSGTSLCIGSDCRTSWPASGGTPTWGGIAGTLSDQTDLQSALDAKLSLASWYATTTDGLAQGSVNKYWSNTLFDARLSATTSLPNITTLAGLSLPYSQLTGTPTIPTLTSDLTNDSGFITDLSGFDTGDLAEGSNLYWTNTRFDNRLTATTTLPAITTLANLGTIKTSLSGLLKASSGVLSAAVANTDYQSPITLTTTGSSGAATFDGTTLNIPQYAGTTYTASYPVTLTGSAFGLAFGTSTSNTWGGTQTFTSAPVLGSLTGLIKGSSGTLSAAANGTDYTLLSAVSCTNQVLTALTASGGSTCSTVSNAMLANSTISGVALGSNLAALTATDSTLTFSGSYNGSAARTVSLNLGNANTWTALQTFGNASSTAWSSGYASSTSAFFGALALPNLGTAAGSFLAVDGSGNVIATTTPSGGSGVTSVTGTYPVISSGGTTPALSLAFGTTTSNTWGAAQTFGASDLLVNGGGAGNLTIAYTNTATNVTATFPARSGTVTLGTGTANRLPIWISGNIVSSDPMLTLSTSTDTLFVNGDSSSLNDYRAKFTSNNDGSIGSWLDFYQNSVSPEAGDTHGIDFYFKNASSTVTLFGSFSNVLLDSATGSEDDMFVLTSVASGSNANLLFVGGDELAIPVNGITVGEYTRGQSVIQGSYGNDLLLRANTTAGTGITLANGGNIGIASTTPSQKLGVVGNGLFSGTVQALSGLITNVASSLSLAIDGAFGVDTTSNQFQYRSNGSTRVLGNGNFYPAFTYATSTAWTGTTTIPLGTAYVGETWNGVQCFTDAGTLNVSFYDGTNRMNMAKASTTVGTQPLSTNNTFTAAEKRYVDVGTPASSPTKISCTVSKSLTAD